MSSSAAPAANIAAEFIDRYHDHPVLFVQEVWGVEPDEKQAEVMNPVAGGARRISVASGHGVGKTTTLAWIIIWWMLTRFPQRTVATAATGGQLFGALANEVKAWIGKLPEPLKELFEIKAEQIDYRPAPNESYCAFRTSRAETPEALAGVHADNVLLIGDEASGIPEVVFEAAAGSMSGHNAVTILAGNPVRRSGLFFDTFHKLKGMWHTVHISCVGHPRVTPDFVEDMKQRYGEDSNAYRVRVLGLFPLAEDDVVITYSLAAPALDRDVEPLLVRPIWGLDVARKGRDACALARRRGNVLMQPVESWKGRDTMATVGRVKAAWDETFPSDRPSEINVDAIGIGAGVADRLLELGLPARSINVSESAAMSERYDSLRAELWFKGQAWFDRKDCNIHGDHALLDELTNVTFDYKSNGKIFVEAKKDMKKRGLNSPNLADAFLLTLASEAVTASGGQESVDWRKPLQFALKGLV